MLFGLSLTIGTLILAITQSPQGYTSDGLAGGVIALLSVVFLIQMGDLKKAAYARVPLLLAYFWRLLLVVWDIFFTHIFGLPNSGADSSMFFRMAVQFVNMGDAGRGEVFSTVMGTLFRFCGISKLYGQYLIMLTSVLAIYVFARILEQRKVDRRTSFWAVLLLALLPNYAILSSIFLREAFVAALLAISVALFIRWLEEGEYKWFLLSCLFPVLAAMLHSGSIAMLVGYIAVLLLYDRQTQKIRLRAINIIPAAVMVLVFVYLFNNYGELLFAKMMKVESLEDIGSTAALGGSSYAEYVGDSKTLGNMLRYSFARIVYFLFSPFPWQWRGLADIIAFVFSSMFYLVALLRALRYLLSPDGEHKGRVIALLIVAFCVVFVFAWGVNNTGTATRHRDKLIVLFACINAFSMKRSKGVVLKIGSRRLL